MNTNVFLTVASSGTGTAYPFGVLDFVPGFEGFM